MPDTRARIVIVEDNSPDVLLVSESLNAQSIEHELIHYRDASDAMNNLADLVEIDLGDDEAPF